MSARNLVALGALVLLTSVVGCHKPNMEDMMAMPPRPAALDDLNMFVGTWKGTYEMKMAGTDEVMTGTSVNRVEWGADNWVLIEHMEAEGAENPEEKYVAMGTWVYDPSIGKFRIYGFNNMGSIEQGTATYDAETRTWHHKGKSRETNHGKTTVWEGTTRMLEDGGMEWNYTSWADPMRFKKMMEMSGTARRI